MVILLSYVSRRVVGRQKVGRSVVGRWAVTAPKLFQVDRSLFNYIYCQYVKLNETLTKTKQNFKILIRIYLICSIQQRRDMRQSYLLQILTTKLITWGE
jgi:hypothetical protein